MKSAPSVIHYLSEMGIFPQNPVHWNLSNAALVEFAVKNGECSLSQSGAVIVETGMHTGRSPKDKYIVDNGNTKDSEISWGSVNKPISISNAKKIFSKIGAYLEQKTLFIQDIRAGRHPDFSMNFRIITDKAWSALFSQNLLIPNPLENKENPDFTILHAPDLYVDPAEVGTSSSTVIFLDFDKNLIVIAGTAYAGEIKKSVFSVMNRLLPSRDVLPMHCSANIGLERDTALFFGLSGTGKTTLSSSPDRRLIGDDEHGWFGEGVFNFEGGCYAKTINLQQSLEPLIWDASQRFGSVLENVIFDPLTRKIDFNDDTKTENTRAAYPIGYINNHVESGIGNHPKNIFFLTADAFGVLPPIAKLSKEQAIYYFLLGYTAKLAGTERGLGSEPEATFSTCFGEPFLPLSPGVYANLLQKRLGEHQVAVWLINTGWSGGSYGEGERIKLPYSRAIINASLNSRFSSTKFHQDEIFNLMVPNIVEGVPEEILYPRNSWRNPGEYDRTAKTLASKITTRMRDFSGMLSAEILESGPRIRS